LEAPRFDNVLKKFLVLPSFGLSFVVLVALFAVTYAVIFSPISSENGKFTFDIHSAHKQLAKESQQSLLNTSNSSTIPGLNGDRTKRYTISMHTDPINPLPNQDVTMRFTVYDASSGNRVVFFRTLYDKPMHLIIVTSDLTYFQHIHPVLQGDGFEITTQFPKNDLYHIYTSLQPVGGIEQQIGFTLPVEKPESLTFSKVKPDNSKTKVFDDYAVSLDTHGTLSAQAMSLGQQKISFTIKNVKTGKPVTNLKPYLASFGHLTMINQETFDFIHVHPFILKPPSSSANGGPTVDFLPIGIYGPFKPGIYRCFAEFNPNGKLFTADFTLKIE
jgi:hypothetical protein